jgi:hypothetical protein
MVSPPAAAWKADPNVDGVADIVAPWADKSGIDSAKSNFPNPIVKFLKRIFSGMMLS